MEAASVIFFPFTCSKTSPSLFLLVVLYKLLSEPGLSLSLSLNRIYEQRDRRE